VKGKPGLQIWRLQTGMLLMACRGHETEVSDLAVSCDNSVVASSSNDHSIRVWSLKVVLGASRWF